MPKTLGLSFAVILTAFAIGAGAAQARGGSEDIEAARERLQQQFEAQRTGAAGDCATASLWEMMFGHEDGVAVADTAKDTSS